MVVLFIALICCFTAWGIAQDLTTPMVAGFKRIFNMSTFQASLVQLAYFGAYFLLALPAAFINQRFGYKTGILSGLVLAAVGAFLFFPASKIMTYSAFLIALFAMAAGCSMLETSANPYVISLGPESTATRRLNFAQAFNPVGTNIGVLLASTLILPRLADPVDISSLTPDQGARGARVSCRCAVRVCDGESDDGGGVRRRLALVLPVADVPDHLRRRAQRARTSHEVRGRRPRDGDRGRRDHAGTPGQAGRCDQPGVLVHRPGVLLRGRRSLRAL